MRRHQRLCQTIARLLLDDMEVKAHPLAPAGFKFSRYKNSEDLSWRADFKQVRKRALKLPNQVTKTRKLVWQAKKSENVNSQNRRHSKYLCYARHCEQAKARPSNNNKA